MMPDATWKAVERRVARLLRGRRVGPTGQAGADVVVGNWLVVEVKHRRTLPQWLKDALGQARRAAGPNRLGIAVLHEKGRHDSLVLVSLSDFVDWFTSDMGKVGDESEARSKSATVSKVGKGGAKVIGR